MNPYKPPSGSDAAFRSSSIRNLVFAAVSVFVGLAIARPGVAHLVREMNGHMASGVSGRPFASYDPELELFGISITPAAAKLLAFGVAPVLLCLSAFFVYRGLRDKYRRTAKAVGKSG